MESRWPYGCCFKDLFNTARSILVQLPSSFFAVHYVSFNVVYPYSSMDMTAALKKKLRFILTDRSDFHMTNNLSIAHHDFASHALMSFSGDETQLPRLVNLSTCFRELPLGVEMSPL